MSDSTQSNQVKIPDFIKEKEDQKRYIDAYNARNAKNTKLHENKQLIDNLYNKALYLVNNPSETNQDRLNELLKETEGIKLVSHDGKLTITINNEEYVYDIIPLEEFETEFKKFVNDANLDVSKIHSILHNGELKLNLKLFNALEKTLSQNKIDNVKPLFVIGGKLKTRKIKGNANNKKQTHKKQTHKKQTHKKQTHKKQTHKKQTHKKHKTLYKGGDFGFTIVASLFAALLLIKLYTDKGWKH
jgi:hypothetical protein